MNIREALNSFSRFLDEIMGWGALDEEECKELSNVETVFYNYFENKENFIIFDDDEPVYVCDTESDVQEMILSLTQERAYEVTLEDFQYFGYEGRCSNLEEYFNNVKEEIALENKQREIVNSIRPNYCNLIQTIEFFLYSCFIDEFNYEKVTRV
jgi:hypothetical protein